MSDLENFRRETRAWLEANCPPEMRRPMSSENDTYWGGRNAKFSSEPQRIWFERMRDKGWTVPDWPKEYGGGGLDAAEHKVPRGRRVEEVVRRLFAPGCGHDRGSFPRAAAVACCLSTALGLRVDGGRATSSDSAVRISHSGIMERWVGRV